MITFQKFCELRDITPEILSGIELEKKYGGFEYNFEIDGIHYKVELVPAKIGNLKGYKLNFHGNDSFTPTGLAGTNATTIYGIMMSVVRKVMMSPDAPEMQYIEMSPAVERTQSIYERLMKRTMPEFMQHSEMPSIYVRRDILQKRPATR